MILAGGSLELLRMMIWGMRPVERPAWIDRKNHW